MHMFKFKLKKVFGSGELTMILWPLFWKTDEAGRVLLFIFLFPKKQQRSLFILSKPNEAPFLDHFKYKNVDILFIYFIVV